MYTAQRKIHSLMIFVLIFDASEAFNFAVLKAPFFFSRIRSLTPLRLKDISAASHAAIAEASNTEQDQHPYFPSASPYRPTLALAPRSAAAAQHSPARIRGGAGGRRRKRGGGQKEALPAKRLSNAAGGGRPGPRPAPRPERGAASPARLGRARSAPRPQRRPQGRLASRSRCRRPIRPHRAKPLLECLKKDPGFF